MIASKRSTCRMCLLAACLLTVSMFGQGSSPATYLLEGQRLDHGAAVNGPCQFRAELWDRKSGSGARTGPVQVYRVDLKQGRFSIRLNAGGEFGPEAFRGRGYWLQLEAQCASDAGFVSYPERLWVGEAAAAYDLNWWTTDGGGGASTAPGYELTGTIGQPDAGQSSAGSYVLYGGFWCAPGSAHQLFLPLIIK